MRNQIGDPNMTQISNARARIREHCRRYPKLTLRDLFKELYQSAFGCEHLIASPDAVLRYIREEWQSLPDSRETDTAEPLAGNYSRVYLSCLNDGLRPETLAKLFFLSARHEPHAEERLTDLLDAAREMAATGELPFSTAEFDAARAEWQEAGYPAIRHSDLFRESYHPAYRVISHDFILFLPLLTRLDAMLASGPVRLAIEGGSASGKSTLAELLREIYQCTVFHMDDFFLRPEQRTRERLAEAGGNVDRERFLAEVLEPLSRGERVCYRPFDCMRAELADPITVAPAPLTVIEGVYSMHPELADYYDLSVFLHITPEHQRERIEKRNTPPMANRFFSEWIPLENRYFNVCDTEARCDLSITVTP